MSMLVDVVRALLLFVTGVVFTAYCHFLMNYCCHSWQDMGACSSSSIIHDLSSRTAHVATKASRFHPTTPELWCCCNKCCWPICIPSTW